MPQVRIFSLPEPRHLSTAKQIQHEIGYFFRIFLVWLGFEDVILWHGLPEPPLYEVRRILMVASDAGDRHEFEGGPRISSFGIRNLRHLFSPWPVRGFSAPSGKGAPITVIWCCTLSHT
jgi:hypothetical protein